jgi:DNA-binding NtrC family response regulator
MGTGITTTLQTWHGQGSAPAIERCQLVVVDGPDAGRACDIDGDTTVGTDTGCDLVLTDERASSKHAVIRPVGAGFYVRDLDSKNGTLVAGSAIAEAEVAPGTTLKIGHSFVRIQPRPQPLAVTPSSARAFGELVGESLAMREVFAVLELAAKSDVTVLLEGETGTGKELAARAVHDESERRRQPFVALDCGALPASLIESELFGHEKGAFTGAEKARKGALVRAHGGTLFLDELDAIEPAVQARLLRVLEERKVRPVGADVERDVDVRLIAASQRDLALQVSDGSFRPDLYYRLAVLKVPLPALRERREDLPLLVDTLLKRRGFNDGANVDLRALRPWDWPGNTDGKDLRLSPTPGLKVPDDELGVRLRMDLPYREAKKLAIDELERRYLEELLAATDGNVSEAARRAQMDRKHLHELLTKHGLGRS